MNVFVLLALLPLATPAVKETSQAVEVRNAHYIAIIGKTPAGLLTSLRSADGKTELVANHTIYTDVGIYGPGRGYVSARNEQAPHVTLQRGGDKTTVTTTGRLRGKLAEGKGLIAYRVAYTFDSSPRIAVLSETTPPEQRTEVRAFLATNFVVPRMREWAVNTLDGVVREDWRKGKGRSYQSKLEPLDLERPEVEFVNSDGSSLLVSDIRYDAPTPLQDVIIHDRVFFFAWFDCRPAPLAAKPYSVSFVLTVGGELQ